MENLLKEAKYNFVSKEDKNFIIEFTKEMDLFGYEYSIEDGSGPSEYRIIYYKKNLESKKIIASIDLIEHESVFKCGEQERCFMKGIILFLYFFLYFIKEGKIEDDKEYVYPEITKIKKYINLLKKYYK